MEAFTAVISAFVCASAIAVIFSWIDAARRVQDSDHKIDPSQMHDAWMPNLRDIGMGCSVMWASALAMRLVSPIGDEATTAQTIGIVAALAVSTAVAVFAARNIKKYGNTPASS